jgi:hypothetical protein
MGEIKSAFKVVAVVKTEGSTLYASLFGRTPRIYATELWHRDGPFFPVPRLRVGERVRPDYLAEI